MSTVHQPRLITVEVFERLAGDSGAESIDGVIVKRPAPNIRKSNCGCSICYERCSAKTGEFSRN